MGRAGRLRQGLLVGGSWRGLLFILSGLPLGVLWFSLLLTAWALCLALAITPLAVPMIWSIAELTRACAAVEASLARSLLGVEVYAPLRPPRPQRWWGWVLGPILDPGFWRAQAYLGLRALLGLGFAVALIAALGAGLGLIAIPFYDGATPEGFGSWILEGHSPLQVLSAVAAGCVVLAVTLLLVAPIAALFRSSASSLLSEETKPLAKHAQPEIAMRRLTVHAWASALVCAVLVLIWALAGGGSFWPSFVILPLALAVAIHGWAIVARRRPELWRRGRVDLPLALHGGVWLATSLFFVGLWAAAGAGGFWAAWPILGLGVVLAIHASVVYLASPRDGELSERIEVLTTTRAGAVDAEGEKLRRIERDLHDGAQARLVALGMSLGMAEQKLAEADAGQARELLAEARAGAEQALVELRDLARGIHPPVLADRGLEAAVRSLADLSPMQVGVDVHVPARPDAAVESAAYFVAAEGLANAAKHANASRVEIRVQRRDAVLYVSIVDDGRGGADPNGSGLVGLRRRVEALDGRLRVASPPGGPTILSAELACG